MIRKINSVITSLTRIRHCEERSDEAISERTTNSVEIASSLKSTPRNDTITSTRGQTALILILLTAAALIFYAITLNWGRVAQTKSLVSMAAYQGASVLASDAASYGEAYKVQYLKNKNKYQPMGGGIMAVIGIIVVIIVMILAAICHQYWAIPLLLMSLVVAGGNLMMQMCVIQPMISSMWNAIQQNQSVEQQFYEQGVETTLQASVGDQVQITDYLDSNANGMYGFNVTTGAPNDVIGRFAFFYTDRLKMLNKAAPAVPQAAFFLNQLGEFVNGETCAQNAMDHSINPYIPIDANCPADCAAPVSAWNFENAFPNPPAPNREPGYGDAIYSWLLNNNYFKPGAVLSCAPSSALAVQFTDPGECETILGILQNFQNTNPSEIDCQMKIPNGFQLNDACPPNSDPTSPTYNPYCDPCCQPPIVADPNYCPPKTGTSTGTSTGTGTGTSTGTGTGTTTGSSCSAHPTPYIWALPSGCPQPSSLADDCNPAKAGLNGVTANPGDPGCAPTNGECTTNNPYGSSYPYLYDPIYQNYMYNLSFLDQFGRDQQSPLAGEPPFTNMTLQGNFPNGIYPFFWLMKDYSPEVDGINPTSLQPSQYHWCVNGGGNNYTAPTPATLAAFPELTRLGTPNTPYSMPVACSGQDCCVSFLGEGLTGNNTLGTSSPVTITITSGVTPTVTLISPVQGAYYAPGQTITLSASATEDSPGSISSVVFQINGAQGITETVGAGGIYSVTISIPTTLTTAGTISITATATDIYGTSVTSSPVTITISTVPPSTATGTNISTGTNTGTNISVGTDTGTNISTGTDTGINIYSGPGTDTGTNSSPGTDTGANSSTGIDVGT